MDMQTGMDATMEEEYAYQSNLLQEFTHISNIDKAWIFKSDSSLSSQGIDVWGFYNCSIPFWFKTSSDSNPENEGSSHFEIWSSSHMEKEFHIPQSVHGSVYTDGWFEGISWNLGETCQRDWEDGWGETYAGKRQPSLFVININSGEVQMVKGIDKSLSVGQVVWAPSTHGSEQYLVFVGWPTATRKLGMKYCSNRDSSLYAVKAPYHDSRTFETEPLHGNSGKMQALNLTQSISSALFLDLGSVLIENRSFFRTFQLFVHL
ncbi:hypothetical protein K1719_046735 [Acacia pycnantha]|nr:hypothetical protein K1719_046735 [Acacia pycnantha]